METGRTAGPPQTVGERVPTPLRLQKLLAAAGLGSRRTIEQWIREGRLTIGGRPARLGDRAAPGDDVRLDGARLRLGPDALGVYADGARNGREVLLYHKPLGEVTTRSDPQGRATVFDRLPPPRQGRWIVIGRLDVNTSGLLLFTTDGDLAHRLMHPSAEVEREYRVRVRGTPGRAALRRLVEGVRLDDGPARFDRLAAEPRAATERATDAPEGCGHTWYRVVLHEGRNREVRRLWAAVGFEVSRLARVRYGALTLPHGLRPGCWRAATAVEIDRLAGSVDAGRREANPPARNAAE